MRCKYSLGTIRISMYICEQDFHWDFLGLYWKLPDLTSNTWLGGIISTNKFHKYFSIYEIFTVTIIQIHAIINCQDTLYLLWDKIFMKRQVVILVKIFSRLQPSLSPNTHNTIHITTSHHWVKKELGLGWPLQQICSLGEFNMNYRGNQFSLLWVNLEKDWG